MIFFSVETFLWRRWANFSSTPCDRIIPYAEPSVILLTVRQKRASKLMARFSVIRLHPDTFFLLPVLYAFPFFFLIIAPYSNLNVNFETVKFEQKTMFTLSRTIDSFMILSRLPTKL